MKFTFKPTKLALAAGFLTLSFNLQAAPIVLDFEGVGDLASVNDFYNGGTDSAGNSGTNHGINFSNTSLGIVDQDAGGSGNFANEPSSSSVLFFLSGGAATMNVAAGFDTGFSFFYTSRFNTGFVNVYDGLNATGNLLASINLALNWQNNSCGGDPNGQFCNWDPIGVAFSGIAMSVDFGGTANQVGFDNITLGSKDPIVTQTPIPGAFWLMGSGLVGLLKMRRKGVSAVAG